VAFFGGAHLSDRGCIVRCFEDSRTRNHHLNARLHNTADVISLDPAIGFD